MIKFFNFMDSLPIVRALQVFAVLTFVFSVIAYIQMYFVNYDFTISENAVGDAQWNWLLSLALTAFSGIVKVSSNALILLALAEIIKLMKEMKND